MKIYHGSDKATSRLKSCVVTLGVFDGVHLGHQHLLKACRRRAQQCRLPAAVYTFEPHPVRVLSPTGCPPLLMTPEQKLAALKKLGLDLVIVEPFTKRFSHLTPEKFYQKILVDRLNATEIFVGYDFTFGAHRRGTTSLLQELGDRDGRSVHIVEAFFVGEFLVSSTAIRQLIQAGQMPLARQLLGRPYRMTGRVTKGDGLGQQLGFPTANLKTDNELIPATGVYATYSYVGTRKYRSVTNVGRRPTFQGKDLRIESHLLRSKRDLKNRRLDVEFLHRLREERHFSGPQQLVEQIHKDIESTEKFFQDGAA